MATTVMANASNATSRPRATLDPIFLDYWYKAHWIDFGFRTILVVVGLVMTILGLVAIYRARSSRPYGFVRILYSMFLCLLVNKLVVMVFDIIQYGHRWHWPMGDALCRIHGFMTEAMRGGIAYQLLVVSGYMVLAIKKPGWTQRLDTKKGAAIFLGVFWLLVFAFNAEALGAHSAKTWSDTFTSCWSRTRTRRHWNIWIFGYVVFLHYVPWFLLAGMAGFLYYHRGSGGDSRDHFRLALSFAVLFTVCKGPWTIFVTRIYMGYYEWHWSIAYWFIWDLMWWLQDLYSAVLPFLFLLLLPDLRLETRGLMCRVTGRAPPPGYSKEIRYKRSTDDESNLI